MYSSIKWQSSTMQNQIYFCTNLIPLLCKNPIHWQPDSILKVILGKSAKVMKQLKTT